MGKILKFRPHGVDGHREQGSGPGTPDAPPAAEVIVFPRMSLKYLCQIAEAMEAAGAHGTLRTTAP
jgi:hypothetical protein